MGSTRKGQVMRRCEFFLLALLMLLGCQQTPTSKPEVLSPEAKAARELYGKAVIASRDHENARALELIGQAIDKAPTYADAYFFRAALLLYSDPPRPKEALLDAKKAVELEPNEKHQKMVADCQKALDGS